MTGKARRFAKVTPKVEPGVGVEPPPSYSRGGRRFAVIDSAKASHAVVAQFYSDNPQGGQSPVTFDCSTCDGISVDGVVHHAWFCEWWDRPKNKTKTPF